MDEKSQSIKQDLEIFYDLPFEVSMRMEYKDPVYCITPQNYLGELFEVKIHFRQKIRMIVEIEPQKYAASMIEEINHPDEERKKLFLAYAEQINRRCSKFEFFVNQNLADISTPGVWEEKWNSFRIRATQIIEDSLNDTDEINLMREWARLFVGLILALLKIEQIGQLGVTEGKMSQVLQNKYERNPVNRELCLSANGFKCKICEFDFENVYGKIGHEFIHVHHIEMVSAHGGEYYLDPVNDMIPVCPNCHAMLHRENPPIKPDKLREIIVNQKGELS